MRLRSFFAFLVLLTAPLIAQQQCILSGEPRMIRSEGLAEPLGSIILQCFGGAPGQTVSGVIQLTPDSRLGNRLNGGFLQDVILSTQSGSNWLPLAVPARLSGNSAVFESLTVAYNSQGQLGLRISGLRGQGQQEVRGFLSFLATPALPLPTAVVVIGRSESSLLSGFVNPSYGTLTTRVTENVASAFGGPGDLGARVLVRFLNVPKGGSVTVPNVIAGSNAVSPTSAGAMSLSPSAGAWHSGSNTLLLVRVEGADSNGAGGSLTFTPQAGLNNLEGSGSAAWHDDVPYAVFEVVSANPAELEFAEIPSHLGFPHGWQGRLGVVRPVVQLGPVSATSGPAETLPIPRFAAKTATRDCDRLGDCRAEYFPRVVSFLNGETPASYQMPANSQSRNQYIAVRNEFGGLAEWEVFPRYKQGAGWLRLHNVKGINNSTVAWYYDTQGVVPGRYEADLVVRITNGPEGLPNEQTIALSLSVTPAVEPPKPDPPKPDPPKPEPVIPVITDVVNGASGIAGPLAPGSLVLIKGESFTGQAVVRIDNIETTLVSRSASELLVEAPLNLTTGKYTGVVVHQDGGYSGTWGVDIVPVAPAILQAENEDEQRNTATQPAVTGVRMLLKVTGVRLAGTLTIKIHDRFIEDPDRVEKDPLPPGIDIFSFVVPEDLPAMSTAVTICGAVNKETAPQCAEPFEVFLRKP